MFHKELRKYSESGEESKVHTEDPWNQTSHSESPWGLQEIGSGLLGSDDTKGW